MLVNKKLIKKTIELRRQKNDTIKEFAIRYKTSPIKEWNKFEPYGDNEFQKIYKKPIVDGVKLKFKYTIVTINGRHSNT
jgi:hypothetical protein